MFQSMTGRKSVSQSCMSAWAVSIVRIKHFTRMICSTKVEIRAGAIAESDCYNMMPAYAMS